MLLYFDLFLPTLLLLIHFDSGNGTTETKNNTAALQASLCEFFYFLHYHIIVLYYYRSYIYKLRPKL